MFTFVRGVAMNLEQQVEAEVASGLTDDEWMTNQDAALEALVTDGRHPHFAHVVRGMDFDLNLDALFEFGLQRLLTGFTATS